MLCYQVLAQFALPQYKPVLVTTHIEKQRAKAFLALSGLPFDSGLKVRRFFKTKKEAAHYVSYLRRVYKNHIVPNPRPELAREILSVSRQKMPHLPRASGFLGFNKVRGMRTNLPSPACAGDISL
jgi:hypothetical protein